MVFRCAFACAAVALAALLVAGPTPALAVWPVHGVALCTAGNEQEYPQLTSDGAGGAIVTWQDFRSGSRYDIYAQHVTAAGVADPAWPPDGVALCTAANPYDAYPQIASDGAGGAIVTWQVWGSSRWDIYAQHVTAAGMADPTWPTNGVALCAAAKDQYEPQIVSDAFGGAIVTWTDWRSDSTGPAIYAQHVTAAGTADPVWPPGGVALSSVSGFGLVNLPQIASDGSSGAVVAWEHITGSSNDYDIYAQHVTATGVADPTWPPGGVALCTAVNGQREPQVVSDGEGGAIVTWADQRSGNFDVYAQHVTQAGVADPTWPPDGVALCTAAQDQRWPQIVTDGTGGAIVTWRDHRSGYYCVYAQHVTAAGLVDPAWPPDGVTLCAAGGEQGLPEIASDGSGGAIVTWNNFLGVTPVDIYAQHVTVAGVVDPAWPPEGLALCTVPNNNSQYVPQIVSDGSGGAIVAWQDTRNGSWDIYVHSIRAALATGVSPGLSPPTRVALHSSAPNPVRDRAVIRFDLPSDGPATLNIYDVQGRIVRRAIDTRSMAAGPHEWPWDGRNDAGMRVRVGVYFVNLETPSTSQTRKAVVVE